VLNRLKDASVSAGDVAVFTCRVCGKPRPNVLWTGPDRTQISFSMQTLCDYFDDGLARLQVSVPVCWTLHSVCAGYRFLLLCKSCFFCLFGGMAIPVDCGFCPYTRVAHGCAISVVCADGILPNVCQ